MTGFWDITAHDLLIIGALLAYWWLARTFCLNELNSCTARLADCTMEKFPQFTGINTSVFPSINMSNFTSSNLTVKH